MRPTRARDGLRRHHRHCPGGDATHARTGRSRRWPTSGCVVGCDPRAHGTVPAEAARTLREALSPIAYAALLREMTEGGTVADQSPVALVIHPSAPPEESFDELRRRAAALREALDELEEAVYVADQGPNGLMA